MGFITTTDEHIASGGTVTGNLTIDADLTVTGSTAITTNEVIQGTSIIDVTNTEALLVRKNGDGGDVFTVDTTNSKVIVGDISLSGSTISDSSALTISSGDDITIDAESDINIDANGGDIRFKDNGTNFVTFSSSTGSTFTGNIRTGTSVETANTNFDNLVIEGSSHTGISIFSGVGGSDSDGGIYFGDDDHNNRGQIKYAHSNNSMSFTTNDTTALTIDSNQDVGIGCTPSSGVRLRIEDTNATMRLQASNDGGAVEFLMYPDIASDNADLRRIKVVDGGTMTFESYRSGSFVSDLTLDGSDGSATFSGGITMEGASGSTLTLKSTNTNITGAELVGKLEAYISDASGNLPGVAGSIDWTTSGSIDGGSTKGTNLTFKNYLESAGLQTVLTIDKDKLATFAGNIASSRDDFTISANSGLFQLRTLEAGQNMLFDTGGDFLFRDVDDSNATRLTIKSSTGNVGIGVDSPYNLLHIRKSAVSGSDSHDDDLLVIEENGDHCNINMISDTGSYLMWSDATRNVANVNYQHATGVMGFTAETSYEFYKDLKVTSGVSEEPAIIIENTNSDTTAGELLFYKNTTDEANGDDLGNIRFNGRNSADTIKNYLQIKVKAKNVANTSEEGEVKFQLINSGSQVTNFVLDGNSRISLSNNDSGGTGGADSTSGNTLLGFLSGGSIASGGLNNTLLGHGAAYRLTTGDNNVCVGTNAGWGNHTGGNNTYIGRNSGLGAQDNANSNNTGIGYESLKAITTGGSNTVVGTTAGDALTTASYNVAVGLDSLGQTTTGSSNVAVGYQAMEGDVDGDGADNVAIGHRAMLANVSPSKNVAIGDSAMRVMNGTANGIANCVAIGANAFYGNATSTTTDTNGTIAIGYQSLKSLTTGGGNTAIGYESQLYQTDGASNTSLGYKALRNADNGESLNTVIGLSAAEFINHASSDGNTIVGAQANVGGTGARSYNTVMGYRAMGSAGSQNNIGGNENVFIGSYSGNGTWVTAGCDGNTAVGYDSMSGALNGATKNTAVGAEAMKGNTTGDYNVALGNEALKANETGQYNIAIGHQSMLVHTGGLRNIAIGAFSMKDTDAGSPSKASDDCVLVGYDAGGGTWVNQDCSNLVGIGTGALGGALEGDSVDGTVAIGRDALTALTSGAGNIAMGYQALATNNTGAYNVGIGYHALYDNAGGDSNVAIGGHALENNTSGVANVAIGSWDSSTYQAPLTGNLVGSFCVAIGSGALRTANENDNDGTVAIGYGACNVQAGTGGAQFATATTAVGYKALEAMTTPAGNTAVGYESGKSITTGVSNTLIGYQAGDGMTVGEDNVAVGHSALGGASTSSENKRNVAIGVGSMSGTNAGASQCVAVGYAALDGNLTSAADSNVAVGYYASSAVTSGANNTAVGTLSLDALTTGNQNTAVGMAALGTAETVSNCTAIGYAAMNSANTQDGSTAVGFAAANYLTGALGVTVTGFGAGRYVTTGDYSTAFGYNTLGGNSGGTAVTGNDNTALGANAGRDIEGAAEGNVLVGKDAGIALTTGNFNVLIGRDAGDALGDDTHNTAIGTDALTGATDVDQTVIVGSQAATGVMDANADGTVAIGYAAGASNTNGNGNTYLGYIAGTDITTGDANTIIGYQALTNAQTDVSNTTAIGFKAGLKLGNNGSSDVSEHNVIIGAGTMDGGHSDLAQNTAHFNVAIGNNALGGDTGTSTALTANTNVAVGHDSMRVASTAVNNVAVGYDALENITVGERNTAVGKSAGDVVTTGDYNTCIGYLTNPDDADGQNQIVIGYHATGQSDNSVTLGNGDVTDVYMAEDKGATVHLANINFHGGGASSGGANNLDDYEEGEHTTAITGATSGSWTMDSAQTKLAYTKIGRMVTVVGKFETDSGSGSGTLKISLPFTSADLTAGAGITAGSITINRYGSTSIASQITPIVFEGTNYINIQKHNTDGTSNEGYIQADDIDGIFEGQLSITYFTD